MIALISRILKFSGKYRGRITLAFVFALLKAIFLRGPVGLAFVVLRRFYDGTADATLCLRIGIAIVVCVALQTLFQHIENKLQASAGFIVMADKRMELGAHLRRLPMGYFTEGNIGKISAVLTSDMGFVENNCMTVLADLMGYLFAQVIMVAFLLVFNIWLALAAVVVIAATQPFASWLRKGALRESAKRQQQQEDLTNASLDYIEGIGITKAYNLLGEKSKELSDSFRETCRVNLELEKSLIPPMTWVNSVFGVGTAVLIALSLFLNAVDMIPAIFIVGVLLFVFDVFAPLKSFYGQSPRLTVMNSCLDRLEAVFAEKQLPDEGKDRIPQQSPPGRQAGDAAEVEFQDVTFGYGDKDIFHGVSFSLERNKMLALVGPSGGGKTTVANLLARFWDVGSGSVRIRGKDIRDVPLSDVMRHISMVFQRVYLFQDTVYNNISMGRPDATEAEIVEAAKKARCYDFIMALPDGFQTVIGEGGATLSGGEKQRISIARCILKDAPIVILDEATASVDADNESYIQEAISELCRGKTLLVIAHRLNTIRYADKILVVSEGTIAQQGTHDVLIEQPGIYRDFVTARETSRGWSRRRTETSPG
ncbi:MAG: ABC transporter ATP-binding protein/permease [Oscillospiraceae bacterium]|jgi:ATP-binding cassette subfamily B protein|nr:ABC transporter ATP-binding protein/permease [Oscillospiraceae bacterium]